MSVRIGIACFPVIPTDGERMSLPAFRYHPDPLAAGSMIRSDACRMCGGKPGGYRDDA